MDPFYLALLYNLVLYFMLLGLQVVYRARSHGLAYALSNLDAQKTEQKCQLRSRRAKDNQTEFLVFFCGLFICLEASEISVAHLGFLAIVIMISRSFYILSVLLGLPYIRSLSWLSGSIPLIYILVLLLS
ncbi:MAPEG family protein [Planctobacterium marinum]|uniref:MAPEG family protein n=1 Tax=Planctobacterium marinum TaxID=1631968 RepID=A0AA48I402_9ALTE|nr:hypothetical protein MACH26_10110 [Planctobacterium marinum]